MGEKTREMTPGRENMAIRERNVGGKDLRREVVKSKKNRGMEMEGREK